MESMIGEKAKQHLTLLLSEKAENKAAKQAAHAEKQCGYFKNGHLWTAFDNCSGDCWVEEFPNEEAAIDWIEDAEY